MCGSFYLYKVKNQKNYKAIITYCNLDWVLSIISTLVLKDLDYRLLVEILIFALWLFKTMYSKFHKQGFQDVVYIENEVKEQGDERCKLIADQFGADRVVYWAISNGEEFLNGWSKKKLVCLCEYYKPNVGLKSFRDAFLEVSTLRFDRNLKLLLDSDAIMKDSGKETISMAFGGDDEAKVNVYPGVIHVPDESSFKDPVSEINMLYGFRTLLACKAYNSKGKLQGFLVAGWQDVTPESKISIQLFKDQGKTFHKIIDSVMDKYKLRNKIIDRWFS